ncbi:uncharacterized protein LOC110854907 [Folsomia candida]|uniref:Regulatory protein zeste n=1 Tax=Folsomia candida TaxID=158441 RepID=A0A226DUJ9_FOLCA|nr:uncharacterized protein LOC110854907 [Folsomia candida]OXA48913.1 t-SNARE domain-containing protein 1 [Folsomia candida]
MAFTTLTGNITKTEGAKRSPNFTSLEKEVLVDEIVANLSLLFGQFTTKMTPEIQSEAWGRVLLKVNALGVVPGGRKLSEIKKKYQQLKSEVKAKGAANKRELNETGGGESALSQLDDLQEKILSTLPTVSVEGIFGGFDSSDKPTMKTTTARNHVPRCTPSSRSEQDPSINESPRPTKRKLPETTLYQLQTRQVTLLETQVKELKRIGDLMQQRNNIEEEKLKLKRKKFESSQFPNYVVQLTDGQCVRSSDVNSCI